MRTRDAAPARLVLIGVGASLVGAIAGCAADRAGAGDAVTVETQLRRSIAAELAPGREVLVQTIEIPPHASIPRHWHPGEEYIHVLEGEAELRIDGQETLVLTPGMTAAIPYQTWHSGATGDRGARALIFRVHTEGEPIMVTDREPPAGQ